MKMLNYFRVIALALRAEVNDKPASEFPGALLPPSSLGKP
jgi:hypothetical protein